MGRGNPGVLFRWPPNSVCSAFMSIEEPKQGILLGTICSWLFVKIRVLFKNYYTIRYRANQLTLFLHVVIPVLSLGGDSEQLGPT